MSEVAQAQQPQPDSPAAKLQATNSWYLTRWLFIRLLGVIYLMAFGSYAVQILGLNGSHGVVPTAEVLNAMGEQTGAAGFLIFPTVAWLNNSDLFLQMITWGGTALSILIICGIASGPALILCMILWLSVVSGGGEFTEFQSDGMLIEATLLALFVVPWSLFEPPWPIASKLRTQKPPSLVGIWLLRFMIFRLMFAAGAVKLLSGDETWRHLTALHYHFETQPLPTPLAWYFNQLPDWLLKSMVLSMFVSELIAPWLVFGTRPMRYVSAFLMSSLQIMIVLTGNYTFLNYLMMVLCVPVLDDGALCKITPKKLRDAIGSSIAINVPASRFRRAFLNTSAAFLFFLAGAQLLDTVFTVPQFAKIALIAVAPLHIAERYGLFGTMTIKRPEIEFEGSNDGKSWQPYVISYKVDDVQDAPPWVAPHMPRLAWRLWFAAMEPPPSLQPNSPLARMQSMLGESGNAWVLSLVERMLQGAPDVMSFFEKNPFPQHPPRFIRAWVYDYHFTDYKERAATGSWWWRDNKRQYLPATTLDNGQLQPASAIEPEQQNP